MAFLRTRKISSPKTSSDATLLDRNRVTLVLVTGPSAGSEFLLERPSTTVGRGPGVDLAFEDDAMSREHAAFEAQTDGLRVRDLGSTNGMRVNGAAAQVADLKHGDSVELGELGFQVLIEPMDRSGRAYVLPDA